MAGLAFGWECGGEADRRISYEGGGPPGKPLKEIGRGQCEYIPVEAIP